MTDADLLSMDREARERALDTHGSFIVRAPAGSGKTELLIQRVLALLATVDAPEEVVAMTFTRKAAAEMQQRLLKALDAARGPRPGKDHERRTYELARAVLQRDGERGWDIPANPGRLRIQTIDALAQSLARQLPMTLGLGAAPNVAERPAELYDAAARATLARADVGRDPAMRGHVARLLAYLDNDVDNARELLASMLARRDQWLRHLHADRPRETLEGFLRIACERHLHRLCALLPPEEAGELVALARYAAARTSGDSAVSACLDLETLPEPVEPRRDAWCGLAALLLTADGSWRRRYTRTEGFPPGATSAERPLADGYKRRIEALRDRLCANEPLREALHGVRRLPPARYSDVQWDIVQTIVAVLKQATAELLVVFAEAGKMDFPEVTRRAVLALDGGRGSDLAVALDARVRHLLLDEFQDTSISQYMLLACLTAGWSAADGRTLFVVGDPMQSIYRFREAEVGLFLRSWELGLEGLPLEPLRLTRNFRSQAGLVTWCNEAFERVLAGRNDVATGAVAFEPAAPERADAGGPAVEVHALVDGTDDEEAQRVIRIVREAREASATATIAVLVRARAHLAAIARAFGAAGLRPTAVELDPLTLRPVISDLLALTRALDHGCDRAAWTAVLRAPWCGLALADLAALCEGQGDWSGRVLLSDPSSLARLSADGRERLERLALVVQRADAVQDRMPASERVEHAWLLLGGPACVSEGQRAEALRYFEHLARHEEERGGTLDVAVLEDSLRQLYAAPDAEADPAFHVMTIHKAKGLEFDHVIVPGLARPPKADEARLLLWVERESDEGSELLLAPIREKGGEDDPLLGWLRAELAQRQRHEDERLVYVAATRAKERLHWLACVRRDARGGLSIPASSLLARLWPALSRHFESEAAREATAPDQEAAQALSQTLRRLPSGWALPALPRALAWTAAEEPADIGASIEFSWAGETARRVGVVVHRWMQRMAEDALAGWDAARVAAVAPHVGRALAAGGLGGAELAAARARVLQALTNVVQDPRGRWVLGPHPEHRSELRLSAVQGGRVRHLVLDRTFVTSAGRRWIVDYKAGTHEGADVEAFLDSERERYRRQLETYGGALDPQAGLGLYFPLVPGWREWSLQGGSGAVAGEADGPADIIRGGGPPRTEVP